jgi:hypothetical protein
VNRRASSTHEHGVVGALGRQAEAEVLARECEELRLAKQEGEEEVFLGGSPEAGVQLLRVLEVPLQDRLQHWWHEKILFVADRELMRQDLKLVPHYS